MVGAVTRPAVLVISGSDSSGGAGMQQDVRALQALGVQGRFVVTAITAQGPAGVTATFPSPPDLLRAQIAAAIALGPIGAIKIGMLGSQETIEIIARCLPDAPIVLDPVLKASAGGLLLDRVGEEAMRRLLWPRARIITPNLPEAAHLLGLPQASTPREVRQQAKALGAKAILIKGGHGAGGWSSDLLLDGSDYRWFRARRSARSMRGTGCLLSTAIAAGLNQGLSLAAAVGQAKRLIGRFLSAFST